MKLHVILEKKDWKNGKKKKKKIQFEQGGPINWFFVLISS